MTADPPAGARPWLALLVADLHLTPRDAQGLARMVALLDRAATHARTCFLLGDLFDLWLSGAERAIAEFAPLFAAFRRARDAGVAFVFLPGNRDYNFTAADGDPLGIEVASGEEIDVVLAGRRARLLHGDQLLSDDHGYQTLKVIVRSRLVRWLARHLPEAVPRAIGRRIRRYSDRAVPLKPRSKLRIVPAAVEARVGADVRYVICGHVHHYERRTVAPGVELLVLPPFCDDGAFVVVTAALGEPEFWRGGAGPELTRLPPASRGLRD